MLDRGVFNVEDERRSGVSRRSLAVTGADFGERTGERFSIGDLPDAFVVGVEVFFLPIDFGELVLAEPGGSVASGSLRLLPGLSTLCST